MPKRSRSEGNGHDCISCGKSRSPHVSLAGSRAPVGLSVAFALAFVGFVFGFIGIELGLLPVNLFGAIPDRIFGQMSNETLLAIPFFTFMGLVLERSGMAEDLLDTIGQLFGPVRGGSHLQWLLSVRCWQQRPAWLQPLSFPWVSFPADHAALWL